MYLGACKGTGEGKAVDCMYYICIPIYLGPCREKGGRELNW